jgi:hypothetical protein
MKDLRDLTDLTAHDDVGHEAHLGRGSVHHVWRPARPDYMASGFNSGISVPSSGFQVLELRVPGSEFRIQGSGNRVQGSRFRVSDVG